MRKCAKCGARNDEQAILCSLCNERLGVANSTDSYEPRIFTQGRQTFRGKTVPDPNATRDEPPVLGKPPTGEHPIPSKAFLEASVNTTRHFLLPPLGEPIPIDAGKGALVFGREDPCDLKLSSGKVSRRHAEIRFSKADKAYIRDLGSQNGTFLNDEKLVGERALEDGDAIRLGDFAVTYRKLAPGEEVSKLHQSPNETTIMEAVRVESGDDGALTGDVQFLPITEVMRRLASLRAHGTLNVDVSGMKGWIKLADGKPVEATYAGLEGPPSIAAMQSLGKGHFSFVPDPNAPRLATPAPPPAHPPAAHPPAAHPAKPTSVIQTPQRPPTGRPAPAPGAPQRQPAPAPATPPPSTARRPGPPTP